MNRGARMIGMVACVALLAAAGCKKDKDGEQDAPAAEKKEPVKREARFGALSVGERVLTSYAIEEDKPKRWHYRVQLSDDVVTRYERVGPSGMVHERVEVEPKGGLTLKVFDAYDQEVQSSRLKGGKRTQKRRNGSTSARGCAALQMRFDELGRTTSEACRDKDDQLIPDEDGCFKVTRKWTVQHQLAEEACLDAADKPQVDRDGVHRRVYAYNDKGQRTSVVFHGAQGKPLSPLSGCVSMGYGYDAAHNRVAEICQDGDGKPMTMIGSDAVRIEIRYDDNGCEAGRMYKQANGERTTKSRVGERRYERDPVCALKAEETRDLKGKLQHPYGRAAARREYDRDALGLMREERCFNTLGKPTPCWSTGGIATVLRYDYDEHMRLASEAGFDAKGKPMRRMRDFPHLMHLRYDDEGRMVKKEFFDAKGEPSVGLRSAHAILSEYDAFGMLVKRRNLGIEGQLVVPGTRCAMITLSRNEQHQLTGMKCLDASGLPTNSRLVWGGVSWNRAATLTVVRSGGRVRNVFHNTRGGVVKELDCSKEGVRCIR